MDKFKMQLNRTVIQRDNRQKKAIIWIDVWQTAFRWGILYEAFVTITNSYTFSHGI